VNLAGCRENCGGAEWPLAKPTALVEANVLSFCQSCYLTLKPLAIAISTYDWLMTSMAV